MTELERLIKEYCPNGVEYKTLGELGAFYGGLTGKSKDDFVDGNAKFITYMNVFSNIELNLDTKDAVQIGENEKQNTIEYGDVLFTGSSETPDECGMSSVLTKHTEEKLYLNSFCFGFRFYDKELILPGFSKYLFRSEALRKQIKKTASGVTRFNVSKKKMEKVTIPIPPVEVQREIVRILDNFAELTAELTAELAMRKKQYEYYREKLLKKSSNAVQKKFGDIFDFQNGFAFKSNLFKDSGDAILRITNIQESRILTNNIVFFDKSDYKENLSPYLVRKGDIVVAMSGATTGKIGVNRTSTNYYLNQRVGKFVPKKDIVLNRYLYHLLLQNSEKIYAISQGGAQPNLSSEKLKSLTALIPPISEQEQVIEILDRYDSFCNDITIGLPAEIKARKNQYEYYRDKLLTFKEFNNCE